MNATNDMIYQNMKAIDKFRLRYGNFKKSDTVSKKKEDLKQENNELNRTSIHSFSDLDSVIKRS